MPVDVPTDSDRAADGLDVAFFDEDVFSLVAKISDFTLFDIFAASELLDLLVKAVHGDVVCES